MGTPPGVLPASGTRASSEGDSEARECHSGEAACPGHVGPSLTFSKLQGPGL